jgi:hypothetical protein
MATEQRKIQHLFLRAGFGETPKVINGLLNKSIPTIVDELFTSSVDFKDMEYLPYPINEDREDKGVSGVQAVFMFIKSFGEMQELNAEWLFKMTYTKAVLRERMTFFWHNHFATNVPFGYLMQVQNNMLRKQAIGKFGDLLHAISKDIAMIIYLNNKENKKGHPNENFAREVMELFTLGEGHYTENDIKEAARAFTGWNHNAKGEFVFNEKQHDFGEKEFLGKKGNFNGDDIINILLENKQTARYITTKIYKEFVNPVVNTERVNKLTDTFYASGYDIGTLMKQIYTSDWFYDEENMGAKICSPVELIVRYTKLVGLEFKDQKTLINLQKSLGQLLFFPPNVAGWKGGNSWIDSTSLLLRLNMAAYIVKGAGINIKVKPAFEEKPEEVIIEENGGKIKSDWSTLINEFKNVPDDKLEETLIQHFIQSDTKRINRDIVKKNVDHTSKEQLIIGLSANIMSLPEFQLI